MESKWQKVTLAEAGAVVLDCEHKTPAAQEEGIPYLAIPNVQQGRIDLTDVRLISQQDYEEWTRRTVPQPGDVLLTRRGRVGDTAAIPSGLKCAIGQNLVLVRSKSPLLSQEYLRWALTGPAYRREVYKYLNVGAIFDSLNVSDIPKFEIALPPLPIQRQIASILSAFDDKIELNRRMNRTLEQMARALFKSWFVDFDPVRAKMRGEQQEGMDGETAVLFPNEFVECDRQEVPKDWTIKSLDTIADFLNGLALQKYPPTGEDDLPVIKIAQLRKGVAEGAGYANRDVGKRYTVIDGDILFSWSGSLEVVRWAGGEGALNQHLFKVTSTRFPAWFVYYWLLEHLPRFREIAAHKATTMGHIQRGHLTEAKVICPPETLLQIAATQLQPLFEASFQNDLENKRLTQLRDSLLPRLLSGDVDVSNWPDAAEQVPA